MDTAKYHNHPISFITTNVQGEILHFNPWAGQLLNVEVGEFIQTYFFEEDARVLVETMQSCEPIFGRVLRFESTGDNVLHMRCTSIQEGSELIWMLEHVSDLIAMKERLEALKVLPRAFGHEINNFLTVIGSAAESIQAETQSDWVREDTEAILSMTQRAATLTRQFMNLGRKSLLPREVVDVREVIETELPRLQRLVGQSMIPVACIEEPVQVFASPWWLKNVLIHTALCFEERSVAIHVDVQVVNYHFANKVLGQPAGEYVLLTICETDFPYQVEKILSTRHLVSNRSDSLQGLWEGVMRFRGGVAEHQLENQSRAVTVFIPWVRV